MARVEISETVLRATAQGNLRGVDGAYCFFVEVIGGSTLATTIYAERTGGATLSEPIQTVDGNISGWLEQGSYIVSVTSDEAGEDELQSFAYEAIPGQLTIIDPADRSPNAGGFQDTTHATANTLSTLLVEDADRIEQHIVNDSDAVIYLRLNEQGYYRLAPNGGDFYSALFTGKIETLCAESAKALTVYVLSP
jgi:hypothetical protein